MADQALTSIGPAFVGVKAITLDLDDTLWPVAPVLARAEQQLTDWLARHAPRTAASLAGRYHYPALKARYPERAHDVSWMRLQFLREVLAQHGEDPALAEPAFECFYEARQQVAPYDEVESVLAHWCHHYRLGVITNGNADVTRMPMGRFFSVVVSAHRFGAAKPDPALFMAASEALAVEPHAILHIGDDRRLDVEAAQQAGFQSAWLRRPDLAQHDVQSHTENAGTPPRVFPDLLAIRDALQQEGVVL
ncbi:MAG: HAD family hydrolase [Lautropia sp.]|nr:HAD family hydrolase [Lautropia sp.]